MKNKPFRRILSLSIVLMLMLCLSASAFAVSMNIAQDIPTYQAVNAGEQITLTFGVTLTDGSVAFQWYSGNGAPISGATSPTLTAKYYQNMSVYCVAVSNTGYALTSNTCNITVNNVGGNTTVLPSPNVTPSPITPAPITPTAPPAQPGASLPQPVITRQPVGVNLANGQSATLSVEAALQDWSGGAQLRYQWYMSSTNSASTAAPISNAYSSTYTTSPYDGNKYYLVAVWSSDGINNSAVTYSNLVAVTYGGTELKITKHPTGETVNVGGSALFIARADNAVKREWRLVSKDTTKTVPATQAAYYFNGLNVSGDQTDSLALSNIPAAMDGWSVECKFTGSDGKTLYTTGAVIKVQGATPTPTPSSYIPGASPSPSPSSYIPGSNVVTAPTISTQPVGAVLSEGETVTLSVGAAGADAAKGVNLSYQWYRSEQNSNANGTPITGATAATYTPDTISGSRYYYVAVTASNGSDSKTTYSSPATVTYTAPISTPSPSPTPSPSAAPRPVEKNPGLGSMIIAPIIAIVVAAIVIGIGIFFLVKSIGKKDEPEYDGRYDDDYDDYYEARRGREERRSSERKASRKIDREYYSDDEFDR